MTDATKLAACPNPWCTAPSKLQGKAWPVFLKRQGWRVWCPCGVATPYYPTESEAIAAWNLRSRPVTSAGVEEAERAAEVMWREESRRASGRDRLVLWADANPEIADNWRGLARAAIAALSPTAEQRAATAALAGELERTLLDIERILQATPERSDYVDDLAQQQDQALREIHEASQQALARIRAFHDAPEQAALRASPDGQTVALLREIGAKAKRAKDDLYRQREKTESALGWIIAKIDAHLSTGAEQ